MKVYIDINQKYPNFELGEKSASSNEVEVSQATLDRWKAGINEYDLIQQEMKLLVDPQPLNPGDPGTTTVDGREIKQ